MNAWIFDRRTDLLAFGGPAVAALVAFAGLHVMGATDASVSPWTFLLLVVGVDVAHVWATAWRVYLDIPEFTRRRALYLGVPAACLVIGASLHMVAPGLFWTCLAYLAVFHFVRQQYGWVAWYRRRGKEPAGAAAWVDRLAIYAATLGPLTWWHAHGPLPFHWFVQGDFVLGLPSVVGEVAVAVECAILGTYVLLHARRPQQPWGKHLVVLGTAVTWFAAIVLARGDLAFTVLNVLPHGIPYLVLCHRYAQGRARMQTDSRGAAARLMRVSAAGYMGLLVFVAFLEEAAWDRTAWHDHPALFGVSDFVASAGVASILVPLLALPQATHYVLDAFIWRAGAANPGLAEALKA